MIPFAAIGAGLSAASAARGLFGGRGGGRGGYRRDPFEFELDENDPELQFLRRQIVGGNQQGRRDLMDEIARAGLIGTGASFDLLRRDEMDTERQLEGAAGSIYGRRRAEAHEDYAGDVAYGRGLEDRGFRERAGALGGIGRLGGGMLQDWWRRRLLSGDDSEMSDWGASQARGVGDIIGDAGWLF